MDLIRFLSDENITNITTALSSRCVRVGKFLGRGTYGAVFEIVDVGGVAVKIQTDIGDEHEVRDEFFMMSVCSDMVKMRYCINFPLFLMVYRFDGMVFKNSAASSPLPLQLITQDRYFIDVFTGPDLYEIERIKTMPRKAVTYGIASNIIQHTARNLFESGHNNRYLSEVIWQTIMALYALRTRGGLYHNDSHDSNIFLIEVKPCTLDYINHGVVRRVNVTKYYAVLGDFGLAADIPIVFTHDEVRHDTLTYGVDKKVGVNYVSDLNRLLTTICSPYEMSPEVYEIFRKLIFVWRKILYAIKKGLPTSKIFDIYDEELVELEKLVWGLHGGAMITNQTAQIGPIIVCEMSKDSKLLEKTSFKECSSVNKIDCVKPAFIRNDGGGNVSICEKTIMAISPISDSVSKPSVKVTTTTPRSRSRSKSRSKSKHRSRSRSKSKSTSRSKHRSRSRSRKRRGSI